MNRTVDSAASGTLGLPLLWSSIAIFAYTRKERQQQTAAGGGDFCSNQNTRVGPRFATSVINAALEGRLTFAEALDLAGLRGRDSRDDARHLGIDLTRLDRLERSVACFRFARCALTASCYDRCQ